MHGNLLRAGLEHIAGHADDIADVVLAEVCELLRRYRVRPDIKLNLAAVVLDVAEDGFPHTALGHNTPRHLNGLPVEAVVIVLDLCRPRTAHKAGLPEGVAPLVLQRLQLIPAHLQNFGQILFCLRGGILSFVAHIVPSISRFPRKES